MVGGLWDKVPEGGPVSGSERSVCIRSLMYRKGVGQGIRGWVNGL